MEQFGQDTWEHLDRIFPEEIAVLPEQWAEHYGNRYRGFEDNPGVRIAVMMLLDVMRVVQLYAVPSGKRWQRGEQQCLRKTLQWVRRSECKDCLVNLDFICEALSLDTGTVQRHILRLYQRCQQKGEWEWADSLQRAWLSSHCASLRHPCRHSRRRGR